jgi:NADH-ubiquinone oxidoreductase chain 2
MVILSIVFVLLSNAVTLRRDKAILYSRVAIITLLLSALITLNSLYLTSLSKGIGIYNGLFQVTSITQIFHVFIFLISATTLQLTGFYPRKVWLSQYSSINKITNYNLLYYRTKITNKMGSQFNIIEYPLIVLFIVTGAAFLVSTSDLVSLFLSIELQSYGLYLLSTLYRNSELATNGGLTYFLLGGFSSCFILLGTSLLYANSGTTNLDGLYIITTISDTANQILDTPTLTEATEESSNILNIYGTDYINMSLLILSVGFLFKISAAPFHFWSPGVYDAIPTIVTTFVAIVAKLSLFIFLLELVHYTNKSAYHGFTSIDNDFSWTTMLLISSLFSLIIGTIVGLTQFRIKRLFAYSTISHVGFILLALSVNSIESIQAFIFYLMQYSISNLNAFIIIISMGYSFYLYTNDNNNYKELNDKNNSPIQLIDQIKGYFYINPVLALSFAVTVFSFAGLPPLIGFFAKQMVLSAALDSGYVFIVLIAILTSVISAVYYLNMIKQVFFFKPEYKKNPALDNISLHATILPNNSIYSLCLYMFSKQFKTDKVNLVNTNKKINKLTFNTESIVLSSSLTITSSIITLITTLFIFSPQEWLSMANILALIIFNP